MKHQMLTKTIGIFRDESLLSYFDRLALTNGYRCGEQLLFILGARSVTTLSDVELRELEKVLRLPEESLLLSENKGSTSYRIPQKYRRKNCSPVCVDCLNEEQYLRDVWKHIYVSACPKHKRRLIDRCPACNERLTDASLVHCKCRCGFELKSFCQHIVPSPVEVAVSACFAEIGCRERFLLPDRWVEKRPPNFETFIGFITRSVAGKDAASLCSFRRPDTIEESLSALNGFYSVFEDWPRSYIEFLRKQFSGNPHSNTLHKKSVGWYRGFQPFLQEKGYQELQTAFAQFLCEEFDGSYFPSNLDFSNAGDKSYLSAKQASKILNVGVERLREAVRQQRIQGKIYEAGLGHSHIVIRADEIRALKRAREKWAYKKEVYDYLGISKKALNRLLDCKLLTDVSKEKRPCLSKGSIEWRKVYEFCEAIRANVKQQADTTNTIEFKNINGNLTNSKKAISIILNEIKMGRIKPVKLNGKLGNATFDLADLEKVIAAHRTSKFYSTEQVGQIYGWKQTVVAFWCRQKYLKAVPYQNAGKTSFSISHQDIVEFQRKFFVLGDVAKQLGTSSRSLMKKLEEKGIYSLPGLKEGNTQRGILIPVASFKLLL